MQDKRLSGTLAKAAHEAIRASEVLRRLRDFYRGGAIKRERLQIGSLSATVAAAFQERLRAGGIELSVSVPENLPNLEVGVIQLEMVLHNLISNSIDALNQSPLATRRIELMAKFSATEVMLRVEDSGPGVAADIVEKVFEPFVTNKVDGMGLGLAISRSLLRAQGGDLVYSSGSQWGGACFIARLPLRLPPEVDRGRPPLKTSGPEATMSDATVFLVDDDAAIRDALSLLISLKGLRTAIFASAEDFLDNLLAGPSRLCSGGSADAHHEWTWSCRRRWCNETSHCRSSY